MSNIFILITISYLIGSIPSGLILFKIFKNSDIRTQGSGNIGATNAMRIGGKFLGGMTFLLDAFKGVVALILSQYFLGHQNATLLLCGLSSVIGHMFPIWLKFKGGKGVATSIAVIAYLQPAVGLIGVVTWIGVFLLSGISSLASLIMMLVICSCALFWKNEGNTILSIIMTLLIFAKHAPNIKRLINGNEAKLWE